jgi:Chlorophyll A-B binding protein
LLPASPGESVLKQWSEEPTGIAAAFLLIIVASLVPAFLGKKNNEAIGPLTPSAELINGRGAMIGFAAMLVIEAVKGSPLF